MAVAVVRAPRLHRSTDGPPGADCWLTSRVRRAVPVQMHAGDGRQLPGPQQSIGGPCHSVYTLRQAVKMPRTTCCTATTCKVEG